MTLLAGAVLLFLAYYGPRTAYLTGARPEAGAWSVAFLALGAGYVAYDALARLPERLDALVLGAFFGVVLLYAWSLAARLGFAARGVYVHAGAFLGAAMAGNVWLRGAGGRARRARHNALFSLPVLLLMVGVGQAGLFSAGVLPTLVAVFALSTAAALLLSRLSRLV